MSDKLENQEQCFVDSNIWLYALIKSGETDEKHSKAKSLISAKEEVIAVSTQVINEVCVNLLRKSIFSEEQIQALIASFYKKYKVIDNNQEVLLQASNLRKKYIFSFWDSLIVASSLQADARILFSEDMQDGLIVSEKLEIINPLKSKN
ncbi:MAG: PIN domain-containing protein [Gomphosphaeria aponina SAG 52.96 = DSM 107014]|uniref:PIN domain-containing protein n=1 Tax=Gomphosphaeria aponina SAG 52.96 = DSM 107014 TaxID=1521640 RepID=A0A941GX33_9CHRO|nr:PIN domain-containing protein [Gomphosphaeria aponina SAG 52.96 = DSM 107014]